MAGRCGWILAAAALLLAAGCCDDCRFPLENHAGYGSIDVFTEETYSTIFSPGHDEWSGGELGSSLLLPDGRAIWFATNVCPHWMNRRAVNALVVEGNGSLELHTGYSAWISPPDSACWYKPMSAHIFSNRVELLAGVFQTTGPGPEDRQLIRTDLVILNLPYFDTVYMEPKVMSQSVLYGSSIVQVEGYTYIYGYQDGSSSDYVHIARVASGSLTGPWSYYDGENWRTSVEYSQAQTSAVSPLFSVFRKDGWFYLVSQEPSLSKRITIRRSPTPTGPWSGRYVVYTMLESVDTFDVVAHRHIGAADDLVLSYNRSRTGIDCIGPVFLLARGWQAAFE